MKHFIDIGNGQLLRVDKIESIQFVDGKRTKVYTSGNVYESDIPATTFASLIELSIENSSEKESKVEKILSDIRSRQQIFGG